MKILKLSQQATVSRPVDSIIGWEEKTIYEPVFVVAEHIESFLFAGVSHIKMTRAKRSLYEKHLKKFSRCLASMFKRIA